MNNELVYVLHTRQYRESSQLVDLFSREVGRLRVVARGVRAASRSKKGSGLVPLQPFQPLFASWQGKSDLKTLTGHDSAASVLMLQGKALYIGFYINELLTRLMPEYIPHQDFFDQYARLLTLLGHGADPEPELRVFELRLLDEMGYGINFHVDQDDGSGLASDADYLFHPGEGFSRLGKRAGQPVKDIFSGADLLAIAGHQFSSPAVRQSAKRLMRRALALHLGAKPLYSRALFAEVLSGSSNKP
ncbi:MAG: DNA repair protein RecO [Porticoccaceae bacterium]|nr:DNA repair protein RecO [Porticoccaceae bacterium]